MAPITGSQTVMARPLSVRRVMPPISTMRATSAASPHSQAAMAARAPVLSLRRAGPGAGGVDASRGLAPTSSNTAPLAMALDSLRYRAEIEPALPLPQGPRAAAWQRWSLRQAA